MADTAAMPHDVVRQHRVVLFGKERSSVGFDLVRVLLFGPPKSAGQSTEVSVYRDARDIESVAEDNIRSLAANTRQRDEIVQVPGDVTTKVVAKALCHLLDRLRFLPKKARGCDGLFEILSLGSGKCGSVRVGGKECRGDLVNPLICALRTQHGCYEEFQRRSEIQFAVRIGISLRKASVNSARLAAKFLQLIAVKRRRSAHHDSRVSADYADPVSASHQHGRAGGEDPVPPHPARLRHNDANSIGRPRDFPTQKGFLVDDVLANTPLFSALDPQGADALRASLSEVRVAKGQELFHEGEPGDHLYLILDGKVKLGHGSPDGRESLMAILGPGEMFGELSLFDPGLRTSTATALTEATVLALGNEQLMPLLEGRPAVAAALLQALARRLRRTNDAMADLVFSDVPGRVAKALMELGEKFGTLTPDGLLVTHDLTQEELAQLVGASRETVNKALAEFGQRGWIKLESRQVLITDVERLGKRAR